MTSGLRFSNINLHVHTPVSVCFIEPNVTSELIVEQALAAGVQAIAITDHNKAEWVDCVKAAAVDRGLVIFPGVEITVQPGVHAIAIFLENRQDTHYESVLENICGKWIAHLTELRW